jgi:hypothetical protein
MRSSKGEKTLYTGDEERSVSTIGPYLVPNSSVIVSKREIPLSQLPTMYLGNMAKDGGNLIFSAATGKQLVARGSVEQKFVRPFYGSDELINGSGRACIWMTEEHYNSPSQSAELSSIFGSVAAFRRASTAPSTQAWASKPFRFVQLSASGGQTAIVIPAISSENRPFLPVDLFSAGPVISHKCYAVYDAPAWILSLIASKLHLIWISTVCSRMRTDFSYGNKLGWNTFPVPKLTDQDKADLSRCAEDILLAREAHFPATIAELYDPEMMPANLRAAHEANDETLERIYIGRRFKNDTERLEKLFEIYTKMTSHGVGIREQGTGRKPKKQVQA